MQSACMSRADVLPSEQQTIAAIARIGVARAQFFPQLSLTASGGVGGSDFSNIFDPDSRLIYGIGSLTQPIFQGGGLRGQLQPSEEAKKEMVRSYQKTIAGRFVTCRAH
jgi:multidrug efflux system outer membrane protein